MRAGVGLVTASLALLAPTDWGPQPVHGELIFVRYCSDYALCENRVTRLCTVVIGTAFATDALRPTIS